MKGATPFPHGFLADCIVACVVLMAGLWLWQAAISAKRFARVLELSLEAKKPEVGADLISSLRRDIYHKTILKMMPADLISRVERAARSK